MADESGIAAGVRSAAAVVLAAALLAGAVGPAVGAAPAATADRGAVDADPDRVEADRTVLSIDVAENGTATWTVEYFVALETAEDEQAWADLEADVEANTSDYRSRFADRIRSTVAVAENDTGRQMTADRFRVDTRTQPQFGVLVYRFRWTNFAVADDGRLRIGDAIDGYLLDEDTRMVIRWPADYTGTGSPDPDATRENAVIWRGSQSDFVAGEPRVVARAPGVTPTATDPGGTATGTGPGDGGTTPAAGGGGGGLPLAAGVGLVLVAAAGLALYGYRRRGGLPDADDGPEDGAAGAGATAGAAASEPAAGSDDDASTDAADSTGGDADSTDDGADAEEPPAELLSNEERVLKVMREHGGRMKQQEVVDELGWTEAKTSQVVRGLRDEGELEGFRLGRENVLKLPEAGEDDPDT